MLSNISEKIGPIKIMEGSMESFYSPQRFSFTANQIFFVKMSEPFLHPDDSYFKPPSIDIFTFYYGVLNFIIPGLGTILGSFKEHYERKNGKQILVGILQFFLSFLFIGWIWSVIWGMIMLSTCSGHG
jgi:hypothetical protein